jgi:hypothetical protein
MTQSWTTRPARPRSSSGGWPLSRSRGKSKLGDESAQAKAAADHLREQIKALPWDRICDRMLYAIWYGFGVGEAMFDYGPDGKVWLKNILVPNRSWFAFTNAGELRMKSAENPEGEALPPNKFWSIRSGASHDFALYGVGLAHWLYWPVWFKKNAIKFWAVYLEKFGMPTVLGKFPEGRRPGPQQYAGGRYGGRALRCRLDAGECHAGAAGPAVGPAMRLTKSSARRWTTRF